MASTMAKVKYNTAEFLLGINDQNSGTLNFLKFSRNGVVQLCDEKPAVKRPGQYKKRLQ